jgi:hypothetical protein
MYTYLDLKDDAGSVWAGSVCRLQQDIISGLNIRIYIHLNDLHVMYTALIYT